MLIIISYKCEGCNSRHEVSYDIEECRICGRDICMECECEGMCVECYKNKRGE